MPMSVRNTVKFKLDLQNPPPLTDEQRKRLASAAELADSDIDYSDIGLPCDRGPPRRIVATKQRWSRAHRYPSHFLCRSALRQ